MAPGSLANASRLPMPKNILEDAQFRIDYVAIADTETLGTGSIPAPLEQLPWSQPSRARSG